MAGTAEGRRLTGRARDAVFAPLESAGRAEVVARRLTDAIALGDLQVDAVHRDHGLGGAPELLAQALEPHGGVTGRRAGRPLGRLLRDGLTALLHGRKPMAL